jgi:hypothetical protein
VATGEPRTRSVGLEARARLAGSARVADVVASVVLLIVLVLLAIGVGWAAVLMGIAFGDCNPGQWCGVETSAVSALAATRYLLIAFVLLATAYTAVRAARGLVTWPVPVFGIAAVLALFAVVTVIVQGSLPG